MQAQPWRVNLTQNALAQTFCDQAYQNNPAFLAFLQRSGLPFQSESEFTPEVLERRNLLCAHFVQRIWRLDRVAVESVAGGDSWRDKAAARACRPFLGQWIPRQSDWSYDQLPACPKP